MIMAKSYKIFGKLFLYIYNITNFYLMISHNNYNVRCHILNLPEWYNECFMLKVDFNFQILLKKKCEKS